MVCNNCNRVLPDGTTYCLYCGAPIVEDLPPTMPVGVPRPDPVPVDIPPAPYGSTVPVMDQVPFNVSDVPPLNPPVPEMGTPPVEVPNEVPLIPTPGEIQTPNGKPNASALSTILGLLQKFWFVFAAALLIVAIVLGSSNSKLKKELEAAEKTQEQYASSEKKYLSSISDLEGTVDQQKQTIADQQERIDSLQEDADAYNTTFDALNGNNIGMATHYFQATEKFIVVKNGNTSTKFVLTAYWDNGGTVQVDYSSPCATLSFDRETWYNTTHVTVLPHEPGFTVATFSNSVDSQTFSILILVLE